MKILIFALVIFFEIISSQFHKHSSSPKNKRDFHQVNNTPPSDVPPSDVGSPVSQGPPTTPRICRDCSSAFSSCMQICVTFTSTFCSNTCSANLNTCNRENFGCVRETPAPTNSNGQTASDLESSGSSNPSGGGDSNGGSPSGSLSGGAIAGIVIGALAGFAIISGATVAFIVYTMRASTMSTVDTYSQF